MNGSSRFGFDNERLNVGRIGLEFVVGVGERRYGNDVDATTPTEMTRQQPTLKDTL
jgi:hypothetical protein